MYRKRTNSLTPRSCPVGCGTFSYCQLPGLPAWGLGGGLLPVALVVTELTGEHPKE